jgi:hypothetical protein
VRVTGEKAWGGKASVLGKSRLSWSQPAPAGMLCQPTPRRCHTQGAPQPLPSPALALDGTCGFRSLPPTCRALEGSTLELISSRPSGMVAWNQGCAMMPGIVMRCPGSLTSMRLRGEEKAEAHCISPYCTDRHGWVPRSSRTGAGTEHG